MAKAIYFDGPESFRAWLEDNHTTATELLVGFHKRETGKPSLTWPQSVDEALCFGWIDGIRRRVDGERYTIRFTPRKPKSNWSAINIGRVAELTKQGRMRPAGLAAFARRSEARTGVYSFEQRHELAFSAAQEREFRAHPKAWEHFQAHAPGYRRVATFWVLSAKKEETRARRLAELIDKCARGRPIGQLEPREGKKSAPSGRKAAAGRTRRR